MDCIARLHPVGPAAAMAMQVDEPGQEERQSPVAALWDDPRDRMDESVFPDDLGRDPLAFLKNLSRHLA